MLERKFQANLISEIRELFEGCVILKNDANYIQGFPDLLILFRNRWAALEVKQSPGASLRPNQRWWLTKLDEMSYSSLVYPENKEEVLRDLQQTFLS